MTQLPDGTLEKPQLLNDTAELSAETVMTGSCIAGHRTVQGKQRRNKTRTIAGNEKISKQLALDYDWCRELWKKCPDYMR